MRKVRCYDCGKRYDFDMDDFCPKCGAFTLPARSARIGANGSVVRVDGINERNHEGSFVHKELHGENRERKNTALEARKNIVRTPAGARLKPPMAGKGTDFALRTLGGALDLLGDFIDS